MKHKIGIDIHGVLNEARISPFLKSLAKLMFQAGHEVHILSGPPMPQIIKELAALQIPYTHIFSIVDYCKETGVDMYQDERGNWWTADTWAWNKAKSEYCAKHGIDLHLDDSDDYVSHFTTPYARVYTKDKGTDYQRPNVGRVPQKG